MKAITVLTLTFLPGTMLAVCFNLTFLLLTTIWRYSHCGMPASSHLDQIWAGRCIWGQRAVSLCSSLRCGFYMSKSLPEGPYQGAGMTIKGLWIKIGKCIMPGEWCCEPVTEEVKKKRCSGFTHVYRRIALTVSYIHYPGHGSCEGISHSCRF